MNRDKYGLLTKALVRTIGRLSTGFMATREKEDITHSPEELSTQDAILAHFKGVFSSQSDGVSLT